jgi:transglutaminase-like putative cysteine protease
VFLEVEHRLVLTYSAFIRESFLELRMQPKTTHDQTLHAFVLAVGPPTAVFRYRDWQGNAVHHFTTVDFHDRIEVRARSLVETAPAGPRVAASGKQPPARALPFHLLDFAALGGPVAGGPLLERFCAEAEAPPTAPVGEQVLALGRHVHRRLAYRKDVTRYDSTTEHVLAIGAGVCQDFTHVMLGCLRLRGIPCRYVSGYLHADAPAGEPAQSHAWIEFHAPGAGWVPFDPTHDREIDHRYVVVAHGRHYDDVPPNKGIFRGNAEETLAAAVATRAAAPADLAVLHEEVEAIDLPVFREVPGRRRAGASAVGAVLLEEAAAQQQQQQQQQRGGPRCG